MLLGQIEGKVGEKHQAALPKKFRDGLGNKLIMTKGLDKHILIVSEERWKTLLEGTEGRPFINKNTRQLQRYLLGNASPVELDSQGRFVFPEYLRKYAGISEAVIFVGVGRFVEAWSKSVWEKDQENIAPNISDIAEKLSEEKGNE